MINNMNKDELAAKFLTSMLSNPNIIGNRRELKNPEDRKILIRTAFNIADSFINEKEKHL